MLLGTSLYILALNVLLVDLNTNNIAINQKAFIQGCKNIKIKKQ